MEYSVRVRGAGEVRVAAYGMADAEHLVQKELGRIWPSARVEVTDITRTDPAPRLVEEFLVRYWVEGVVMATADSLEEAPRAAFRLATGFLAGSRYQRVEWSVSQPA